MRQVVLDTETTGLEIAQGHRIIEIGAVEVQERKLTGRRYHQYICPDCAVDEGALEVHGLTDQFLAQQPRFDAVAEEFLAFVDGAELVIHNADFDVAFIDSELERLSPPRGPVANLCGILDTLTLAREKHPGQKNNLDALCKRYGVDNSHRDLHGALLDAEILADVYLLMTGGQTALSLGVSTGSSAAGSSAIRRLDASRAALPVIRASADELAAHEQKLQSLEATAGQRSVWRQREEDGEMATRAETLSEA